MIKKIKNNKTIVVAVAIFIFAILLNYINNNTAVAHAQENQKHSLHEQTKIYSSLCEDYFYGCEDYENYKSSKPEITVLTPGVNSQSQVWSNNGSSLGYNEHSLIAKISEKLNYELNIYLARSYSTDKFSLFKLKNNDYSIYNKTEMIDDISKHILIVYESCNPSVSNTEIYDEFENVIDNISRQYKTLSGELPRFNLIGHSRGGLTNIMYASEHPYNVATIISMGTPYNGAILAGIDEVINMLGFQNNDGAKSILDKEESIKIRNAWNETYKSDVQINAIALGSVTSIDLMREIINEAAEHPEYADMLNEYIDLLNTVINVVDQHPKLTTSIINFTHGIAEIFDKFNINIYDELLSNLSDNLKGDVTFEEAEKIIGLINVINDEIILMDDLFIDINSQLGLGFEDGIGFNGFKRYIKIFDESDFTENRAFNDQPGIVHNLETMNKMYVDLITNTLDYGVSNKTQKEIYDEYFNHTFLDSEISYIFKPTTTGQRRIDASGCEISLYQYTSNNDTLVFIKKLTSILTYKYEEDCKYLIVINPTTPNTIDIKFSVYDTLNKGSKSIKIFANKTNRYSIQVTTSGYYSISFKDKNIEVLNEKKAADGLYYIYLSANIKKIIDFKNTSNSDITNQINIKEVTAATLNNETIIDTSKLVVKFTNPYNKSISYNLDLTNPTGHNLAQIFDEYNSPIANQTTNGDKKIYSFLLDAKQTCYIVFDKVEDSSFNLYINEEQLKWKIDGIMQNSNTVTLNRGAKYKIELVYDLGSSTPKHNSPLTTAASSEFNFDGTYLTINNDAIVGYDINIFPVDAPEFILTIKIPYDGFNFNIENGDKIILNWNSQETISSMYFKFGNSIESIKLSTNSNKIDISDYIENTNGTTKIELDYIVINGDKYYNNKDGLFVDYIVINNLFGNGSGDTTNPYEISCYRHLNNIRKCSYNKFILTQDINLLNQNWSPIASFNGVLDGNNNYIRNLKINVSDNQSYFGFISELNGLIKNIRFNNVDITLNNDSPNDGIMVGVLAGLVQEQGIIENCHIKNASITTPHSNSAVGGFAGVNAGLLQYNVIDSITIQSSGNIGGACGENAGVVDGNQIQNLNINYVWKDNINGSIGGLAGLNYQEGNILNCVVSGKITWDSTSRNMKIKPFIGWLIGYNFGMYDNNGFNMSSHISYYYWHFIPWYDQSDNCFKFDDGKVGFNA